MRTKTHLYVVAIFLGLHLHAIAQSIAPGQVTRQVKSSASEPQRVAHFSNVLRENLASTALSSSQINQMLQPLAAARSLPDAVASATANAPQSGQEAADAVQAVNTASQQAAPSPNCKVKSNSGYSFAKAFFPVAGCVPDAITNFFSVSGSMDIANNVQYLYNANQSTNQINADFFTATFPLGFQAILSGTATAGSSQPASSSSTSGQTESVSTAVSKLEQGGDFNLRFPVPVFYKAKANNYGIYALSSPAIGFNVNGLTDQNTITDSTEYNVNVPLEVYFQTGSIEQVANVSSALLYVDVKPAMELVSPAFATAIGLTSHRYFMLGQADAGIEFSGSVRVGLQYFFGPSQVYQVPGAGGSTTTNAHLGGLHLVVSFNPKKSS